MTTPSYWAMHRRLRTLRGPATAQPCSGCGAPARAWTYTGTDPDERRAPSGHRYSLDPGRYQALCASCRRTTAAGHRPVAAQDVDRAVALYGAGAGLAAVAEAIGVTRPVVRAVLTRRGVAIRPSRSATTARLDGDRAAELYAQGASLHAIAAQFHVDGATVRAALTARGVPIRPRTAAPDVERAVELYTSGASLPQVAASCGVGRHAIRSALIARGVAIRPPGSAGAGSVDVERAAALYAAGASLRGIAALLGVTRPAVRAAVTAAGVPIRPPGPTARRGPRPPAPTSTGATPSAVSPPRVIFRPTRTTSHQPTPSTDHRPIRA